MQKDIALKQNLKDFNSIVDCFFNKHSICINNYYPEFCKFVKHLKKNFQELKEILASHEITEITYMHVKSLEFEIAEQEVDFFQGYITLIKERHYSDILHYLEKKKEKKNPSFKVIYEIFFGSLEDTVWEYFYRKDKLTRQQRL